MELLSYLIWLFVVGLVIGAFGRLIVPGTAGMGILRTVIAGLAGAYLGGLAIRYLVDPREDWVGIVIAVLCAALIVALINPRRRVGY